MKNINTRLIILGSGPAGCTAAIYAARSNLKPIMINGTQPGGQLTITTDVENYPGEDPVLGPDLMENMIKQSENVGCKVLNEEIKEINLDSYPYTLISNTNTFFKAEAIIIATGTSAKWLGLENEKNFVVMVFQLAQHVMVFF